MELLTHGGEHHEIGDGGWLMMTTATNPPLRTPIYEVGVEVGGAPGGPRGRGARPGGLSPPGGPVDPKTDAIKSYFSRKKSGRKNYRNPRDGAAAKLCSSSRGRIWSPFGAPERGIFDLRHHQPFSIAKSMMLPAGSE